MHNTDALIAFLAIGMFIFGWITAAIILNGRMKKLQNEIDEIKSKSNDIYESGWHDGWDSLAVNDEAMRRELTRMENMRRVPPHM